MRKQILYKIVEENPLKVEFSGISFLDMQKFFKKMKINKESLWIYQEIPFYNEKYTLKQFDFSHHVRKRAHTFSTGNDCLLVVWNANHDIFNYSCQEILYENKFTNKEEIPFHAWFYDIDWCASLVFNDIVWFESLIQYIQKKRRDVKEVEELPS